jgi:hypothetical protein
MLAGARATWARTAAVAAGTTSATGRFPVTILRGTPAPSAERRARALPGPTAHGALPAWDLRGAEAEAHAREAADAVVDHIMNKEKYMNFTTMKALLDKIISAVFGIAVCSVLAMAQQAGPQTRDATPVAQPQQKSFDTAQQAAQAMIQAIGSDNVAALLEIFGPDGKDFVETGDAVQDRNSRAAFVAMAHERLHVDQDPHNASRAILSVGEEDWPLPVPLVRQGGKWRFDSKAGRTEILNRRIGANELDAITICRGYVEAQKEYASEVHDNGGINEYAPRIISTPGKQDGLSWKNADGSQGGPMGETVATALEEGYTGKSGPYHGYYFKTLKGQGPAAPLGELNYEVEGAMIGGFALVAWPAEYRVSGVQTFIVSYNGIVFQKDLGPDTAKIALAMERYNPDRTWHRTHEEE